MQSLSETLKLAKSALDSVGISYALIGGLALGGRGVHRATMDVDLLVDGQKKEAARSALEKVGFRLNAETSEVMHFTGVGDLDLLFANRDPTRNMLNKAETLPMLQIKCVSAEDLIGLKIQAYINNPKRALQDKADIVALIEKNPQLDWQLVKQYADIFDEWATIQELRKQL